MAVVLATVGFVVAELVGTLSSAYTEAVVTYHPQVPDPAMVKRSARALSDFVGGFIGKTDDVIIGFSRQPIQPAEALQERSVRGSAEKRLDDKSARVLASVWADCRVFFAVASRSIEVVEVHEVLFSARRWLPRKISVDVPTLGSFDYHVHYGDIESLDVQIDDHFVKVLSFAISLRGWYHVFVADAKLVQWTQRYYDYLSGQHLESISQGG